jgi:serine/threonine protein kinase/tetratricopeptide (TPR) repeat protein
LAFGVDLDSPGNAAASVPPAEKPGDRIGRYKLLEKIGEGGCGVVYLAEQEEPVRREVALKVIKLGMDTRQVIARFEAERQALALMEHPNIAKVLDAGATETGRPYFVMELVRGLPITRYCDENQLSNQQRLRLFVQVCQAIQHAHQKGIIHRDIKPSNILVADHDGVPVPKIIDFGIAKATTNQRLTDKTLFTAFEQFIGTPAYMSPEQTKLSGLDIDTRSDIYSLGVLLYELLIGRTPFEAKRLLEKGLDEIQRIIREEEPPRPSTRLEALSPEEQTTVANNRQSDRPKLIVQVRGDLDWIVMKALEKDRARRYETANGLGMDVQRFLADEPVVARPPANLYRLQKLVRRNKLAFVAIGAVTAALLIGLGVSMWLLVKERAALKSAVAAEAKANSEASKSQQVAVFLKKMLKGVGPSTALGRDTTMLREILDETTTNLDKELTNQPEVAVELCLTLAQTYHDLGLWKEMEEVARRSLTLARARFGEEDLSVAESLKDIGDALMHANVYHLDQTQVDALGEAEKYSRECLAISRRLLREPNATLADALASLSHLLAAEGKRGEAESMQREALVMYRKLFGTDDRPEVAKLLLRLAYTLAPQASRVAEAEESVRQAMSMQKNLFGADHPEVAKSLDILNGLLSCQGKKAEAESTSREALAMWSRLKVGDHPEVAGCLTDLAGELFDQERLSEAEIVLREALAMRKRLSGNEAPEVLGLLLLLKGLLIDQGKWDEVEAVERETLECERKLYGNQNGGVANVLRSLGNALQRQGKLAEAETICREALSLSRNLQDKDLEVALSVEQLATVQEAQGKLEDALAGRRQALSALKGTRWDRPDWTTRLAEVLSKLTLKLTNEGKLVEAEALNRECLGELEGEKWPGDWWVSGIQSDLGASLLAQGKVTEAEPLLLAGYQGLKRREYQIPTNAVPRLGEAAGRLARLYEMSGRAETAAEWRKQQALIQEAQPGTVEAAVRRASGLDRARRQRFAKATVDFARALELRPGDTEVWLWQAAALVRSGQVEAYRELRRNAVKRFEHTADPATAERIAKAYLILPSAERGLETAASMAEAAVSATTDHADTPWVRLTKGLAEYREGHFGAAVEWVNRVLSESGKDSDRDAETTLVLAMAQEQSRQTAAARGTLAEAAQIVDTRMQGLNSGYLSDRWEDWVIAHALLSEAKGLIKGSAKTTASP